jgi:hypothetical protein
MKTEDKHFKKAADFVRILHPRNRLWGHEENAWLFRGHANSEWRLLPRACRKEDWDAFSYGPLFEPAERDEWLRAKREAELLVAFGQELDRLGLPLPGNSYDALEMLIQMIGGGTFRGDWFRQCRDLAALAQHHGVPTRLLDFTEDGRIAAYFAAQESRDGKDSEQLCVWALERAVLANLHGVMKADGHQVWLLRAPRASNPNLHAQSGLFVAWGGSDKVVPLDEILDEHDGTTRRLFLPRSEANELLALLEAERITGATMFPNADGIVRHMKERVRIRKRTLGVVLGEGWDGLDAPKSR